MSSEISALSLHDALPIFRLDGHEYAVEEILDQWYGPQDAIYKVRADDGNLYILRREASTPEGAWHPRGLCKRSEEHTSELQSRQYLVCRLLLEKKKKLST